MTLSFWLDNEADQIRASQTEACDVAIIGGGINGCGCAYYLSQRPNLKIVLIESQALGSGSTGRNGGFVLRGIEPYYSMAIRRFGRENARYLYRFAEENQTAIQEFQAQFGNSFEYEQCGSYALASSLEELDELAQSATLMKEDGFAVDLLKQDPVSRDFYGALLNVGDVGLNPVKFVRSLVAQSSASLYENEPVVRLEVGKHGGVEVHTGKRVLLAERVLITSNAYTPLFEPSFKDMFKTGRTQILVTSPLKKHILDKVCCANYGWEYFRQLKDRRLLLGGCRQLFIDEMEADTGYVDEVTKPVQTALEHYLKDRFPEIVGVPIDYRWSGILSSTEDGLPLVGELKHLPGTYAAIAFNGHVLDYGLRMSKLLIEVAFDGKSPGIFALDRKKVLAESKTQDALASLKRV
jgi:gamma-glutamylputrescine oxidase